MNKIQSPNSSGPTSNVELQLNQGIVEIKSKQNNDMANITEVVNVQANVKGAGFTPGQVAPTSVNPDSLNELSQRFTQLIVETEELNQDSLNELPQLVTKLAVATEVASTPQEVASISKLYLLLMRILGEGQLTSSQQENEKSVQLRKLVETIGKQNISAAQLQVNQIKNELTKTLVTMFTNIGLQVGGAGIQVFGAKNAIKQTDNKIDQQDSGLHHKNNISETIHGKVEMEALHHANEKRDKYTEEWDKIKTFGTAKAIKAAEAKVTAATTKRDEIKKLITDRGLGDKDITQHNEERKKHVVNKDKLTQIDPATQVKKLDLTGLNKETQLNFEAKEHLLKSGESKYEELRHDVRTYDKPALEKEVANLEKSKKLTAEIKELSDEKIALTVPSCTVDSEINRLKQDNQDLKVINDNEDNPAILGKTNHTIRSNQAKIDRLTNIDATIANKEAELKSLVVNSDQVWFSKAKEKLDNLKIKPKDEHAADATTSAQEATVKDHYFKNKKYGQHDIYHIIVGGLKDLAKLGVDGGGQVWQDNIDEAKINLRAINENVTKLLELLEQVQKEAKNKIGQTTENFTSAAQQAVGVLRSMQS